MEEIVYFGSPLSKYKVDQQWVDAINSIADQIVDKEEIPAKLNVANKLASAVNKEFKLPAPLVDDFVKYLTDRAENFHKKFCVNSNIPKSKILLLGMWVVSQKEGEWNYLHSHSGAISGILYLKVPANMASGLNEGDKRIRHAGGITFAESGGGHLYRRSLYYATPKVGELYMFPSDLLHTVYPFFGVEERRSLSFNFSVSE